MAVPWLLPVLGRWCYEFCVFLCPGATKVSKGAKGRNQPAVVLALKRLRYGTTVLKSHPTDCESQSDKLSFDKAHYNTTDAKVKIFRDTHLQITKGFQQIDNDISLSRISGQ